MSFVFPRPNRTIAFSLADAARQSVRALRAARDRATEVFDDAATIVSPVTARPRPRGRSAEIRRTIPPRERHTNEASLPSVILAPEVWEQPPQRPQLLSVPFISPFARPAPPPKRETSRMALCVFAVAIGMASIKFMPVVSEAVERALGSADTASSAPR